MKEKEHSGTEISRVFQEGRYENEFQMLQG